MIEFNIYNGDCKVTAELTNEKKDQIIGLIIEWCKKYDCISDEQLYQNDTCNIEAPNLLSDVINLIDFKTEWIEEV